MIIFATVHSFEALVMHQLRACCALCHNEIVIFPVCVYIRLKDEQDHCIFKRDLIVIWAWLLSSSCQVTTFTIYLTYRVLFHSTPPTECCLSLITFCQCACIQVAMIVIVSSFVCFFGPLCCLICSSVFLMSCCLFGKVQQ